jgi:multidrug efflux pump subunit AcrA (membrane-fusion protein)
MTRLFDAVLTWGEKLVYQGTKDDSLPPAVIRSLDEYLAESNSKLLVVLPLKDERETEGKKPPRSGLMMECFDPAVAPDQLVARLEVVGRHATSALYNAAEHRRIPGRLIWMPIAKVQEGLGGKTRAIMLGVAAGLLLLIGIMVLVPYPLKMEAKGQLLPRERRYIFTPVDAKVDGFVVDPGQQVSEGQPLVRMYDQELDYKMLKLQGEIDGADQKARALTLQLQQAKEEERLRLSAELESEKITFRHKKAELDAIRERTNAVPGTFGLFELKSPIAGTVLNGSFREELTHRAVKPNEPILRIGDKASGWQVKLDIPQKHIGQVLNGFSYLKRDEIDVDLVLRSAPTRTFKAKLARRDIGGEATPNRDENNETEPVVVAWVRIDGDDISPEDRVTLKENLLVTGTEVLGKVRCGPHAMGYSLFYGVWEFFYEKIVFFF